ncbi:MAG: molybdopterin-dependent oxidoreductase [Candidatus Eisenbacteria sp.]|nr:molybdopterin-dependent oxidoreductase [Candidatus Eisenbacteria bacterium]
MSTGWRRRDFLTVFGGGMAGIALSPLPWKLLDDAAIWTQNWSWLPRLPRGEISTRYGRCTICPAGCGLRADIVNGQAFRLTGLPNDPIGGGTLCPLGIAGHHLRYHPARLRGPVEGGRIEEGGTGRDADARSLPLDEAIARLAGWINELQDVGASQTIAILDARPGRLLSEIYRRFSASLGAHYIPARTGGFSSDVLHAMGSAPLPTLGIDLAGIRTLLSFGAPVLDDWGAPSCANQFDRYAGSAGEGTTSSAALLIQVETRPSATAQRAGLWLRNAPGSECALALGLAHVIVHEGLYDRTGTAGQLLDGDGDARPSSGDPLNQGAAVGSSALCGYRELLAHYPPEQTAQLTGISSATIRDVARRFATAGPAVAIPGQDPGGGPLDPQAQQAIWNLNLLTGALDRRRGFVSRRALPLPQRLADAPGGAVTSLSHVPDGSLRMLIVDGALPDHALPWELLTRKLARHGARLVSLSPFRSGLARHAALRIPAPAPLEFWEEVPTPWDAPTATLAIAAPLAEPPRGALHPSALLERIAKLLGMPSPGGDADYLMLLRERAAAVFLTARGHVHRGRDGRRVPLDDYDSAEAFWQELAAGGCWIDDADKTVARLGPARRAFLDPSQPTSWDQGIASAPSAAGYPLTLMPFGPRSMAGEEALPPVMAKLYRESHLRSSPEDVHVHPETARRAGVEDGLPAWVETPAGKRRFQVQTDPAVHPAVIHIATGPAPASFGDLPQEEYPAVLELLSPNEKGVWRMTPARLRPVEC